MREFVDVDDIADIYGPVEALEYAFAEGIHPDEWAEDFFDQWGELLDLDSVHELYEMYFGYGEDGA